MNANGSVKLVQSTGNLLSHKRPLGSRLSFFTPNDMRRKYSSRRPSKLTTSVISSRKILPMYPKARFPPSYSTARARRMPRRCPLRSSKKERIKQPNMPYPYPKSVVSQKTRCSKSCEPERTRRNRGNAWLQRPPSLEKVSLVNL